MPLSEHVFYHLGMYQMADHRSSKWLRISGSHVGAPFVRVPPEQAAEERRLLELGLTIKDVALLVGAAPRRLEERNRLLYQIDLRATFQRRIERDGVPTRLAVDASFGHWFAGLFDGEGHFVMRLRRRSVGRATRSELELGLNVYLRDDDAGVLQRVHDALGGRFRPTSKDNVAHWRLRGIATLAEVGLPLFERYPLYSKKAGEFELFRSLVMQRYIATLGGRRRRVPLENVEETEAAIAQLRARRDYADRSSWRVLEDAARWGGISSTAA